MRKLNYVLAIFAVVCMSFYSSADNEKFPKSREEIEKERTGSILGKNWIMLNFQKNSNSIANQKINKKENNKIEISEVKENILQKKYLWQAIIKTLNYAPIAVIDHENGIFITEWFSRKEKKNLSQKVTILVKDNLSLEDAVEVILQQKIKNKNRWVEKDCSRIEAENIKQEIVLSTKKEMESKK